jgi:hypothetical protein
VENIHRITVTRSIIRTAPRCQGIRFSSFDKNKNLSLNAAAYYDNRMLPIMSRLRGRAESFSRGKNGHGFYPKSGLWLRHFL